MSAPPLQNLNLKDLVAYNNLRVAVSATNTFCVYFKSPEGSPSDAPIKITPAMLKRGLDPYGLPYGFDVEIMPDRGVRLEMDTNLPHRIDETTVESVKISEKGKLRSMNGRLVYMSMDTNGSKIYAVEAFSKNMGGYVWNYVRPGESVMVLTITYRVAPNVCPTE